MAGMTQTGHLRTQAEAEGAASPARPWKRCHGTGHFMHKMYFTKYISKRAKKANNDKKKSHLALNGSTLNTCSAAQALFDRGGV